MLPLALILLSAAPDAGDASLQTRTREMMGTQVMVSIWGVGADVAEPGFSAAFKEFERVERVMNEWVPDSPLSAINAAAGTGRFVSAPEDLCEVLRQSVEAAKRTHGLFDPSWAALREIWRFGIGQAGEVPSRAAVQKICPLVSYHEVEISPSGEAGSGCKVRLKKKGMMLGLGGVAKGWAVDRAADAMRVLGLRNFLVQAGGDLYAAGKRGDRHWRVGIREPRGPRDSYFARMEVTDAAFSTSGDYERFFIAGGKRYHHIIDPRTCYPAEASRSASVLARTSVEAEFLTKAAFILGGQKALDLVEARGSAAILVTAQNQVLISKSLRGQLEYSAPIP